MLKRSGHGGIEKMVSKAIEDIINEQEEQARRIKAEREELMTKVEQRKKEGLNSGIVDKARYLLNHFGTYADGLRQFVCQDLVLSKFAYDLRIDYKLKPCFAHNCNGNYGRIDVYSPGEWEGLLDKLYSQSQKDLQSLEYLERIRICFKENQELYVHNKQLSEADNNWETEKADLKERFGL